MQIIPTDEDNDEDDNDDDNNDDNNDDNDHEDHENEMAITQPIFKLGPQNFA